MKKGKKQNPLDEWKTGKLLRTEMGKIPVGTRFFLTQERGHAWRKVPLNRRRQNARRQVQGGPLSYYSDLCIVYATAAEQERATKAVEEAKKKA